jgi:hypothetical protein
VHATYGYGKVLCCMRGGRQRSKARVTERVDAVVPCFEADGGVSICALLPGSVQ